MTQVMHNKFFTQVRQTHILGKIEMQPTEKLDMTTDSTWKLDDLQIAQNCPADWNKMIGTNRVRLCGDCKLHVYNFSELTRSEAEKVVIENEGKFCGRFYRRPDGTILTKDCPLAERFLLAGLDATSKGLAWLAAFLVMSVGVCLGANFVSEQMQMAISSAFSKAVGKLSQGSIADSAYPLPPKSK
jgi:hypothetical protein